MSVRQCGRRLFTPMAMAVTVAAALTVACAAGLVHPAEAAPSQPQQLLTLGQTLRILDAIQKEKLSSNDRSERLPEDNARGRPEHIHRDEDDEGDSEMDSETEQEEGGLPTDPVRLLLVKKANYMTLCHFKLCNMGKRSGWRRHRPLEQ